MAKVTFINSVLSGKLGGLVYAYNKAGYYARTFRKGTNPATVAQLNNQGLFAQASSAWHSLTDVQKGQWNAFAVGAFKAKFPVIGMRYSGFNAFVSLQNIARNAVMKAGITTILDPAAATFVDVEYNPTENAPHVALSGQIDDGTGHAIGFQITSVEFSVSIPPGVAIGITFDRSIGVGTTPVGPLWQDAISAEPVGIAVAASLPLTQSEQFVENPDIELIAISKPLGLITGWTIGNHMMIHADPVPEFFDRKFTYAQGDNVQLKFYLVGQSGQTMPIGALFTTAL